MNKKFIACGLGCAGLLVLAVFLLIGAIFIFAVSLPGRSEPAAVVNSEPAVGLDRPTATSAKEELATFNGIWVQQDGNGVTGQYAILFRDGFVYTGFKGSTADQIYNDEFGLRGVMGGADKKGVPFRLEPNAIVLNPPNSAQVTWRREGTTFWVGTGVITLEDSGAQGPNLKSVSFDGEYRPA